MAPQPPQTTPPGPSGSNSGAATTARVRKSPKKTSTEDFARTRKKWESWEVEKLMEFRVDGCDYESLASQMGRTNQALRLKHMNLEKAAKAAALLAAVEESGETAKEGDPASEDRERGIYEGARLLFAITETSGREVQGGIPPFEVARCHLWRPQSIMPDLCDENRWGKHLGVVQ